MNVPRPQKEAYYRLRFQGWNYGSMDGDALIMFPCPTTDEYGYQETITTGTCRVDANGNVTFQD